MTAEVSIDYDAVNAMAESFRSSADSLQSIDRALDTAAAVLRTAALTGLVGQDLLDQFVNEIRPQIERIASLCMELHDDLLGAIASLRDGDLSGSQRFVGVGGAFAAGGFPAAVAPGSQVVGAGTRVNLSSYQDGVDGWELIPMSGKFTTNELLVQSGPSCTIYGAMNLLVENGYDISQSQADKIYNDMLHPDNMLLDMGIVIDMQDGKHDTGFQVYKAAQVLDAYDADYDHDDFSTWLGLGSPDRGAAENFLVGQLKAGNPVYVTTRIDETFGLGAGAHAYTVVGTQTDAGGKLTNVLVSTNWSGDGSAYEIPAQQFMDDWMAHNDGEYIVLEH